MSISVKILPVFALITVVFISGCSTPAPPTNGNYDSLPQNITGQAILIVNDTLPHSVAQLPEMDLSTVDNYEKYKQFADRTNELIEILNEKTDIFNIPRIEDTSDAWEKASKIITEYSPLINNYNQVVSSAKTYENNASVANLEAFYVASGVFGLETGVIAWAVFYDASYQTVGIAYRAVGLNKLAPNCPSCVRIVLSNAHWSVRNALVEGSSQAVQEIATWGEIYNDGGFDGLGNYIKNRIDIESVKNGAKPITDVVGSGVNYVINVTSYLSPFRIQF